MAKRWILAAAMAASWAGAAAAGTIKIEPVETLGSIVEFRDGMAIDGHRSAGVPGALAGVAMLHARHGRLAWADLVRPAVALAAEGVGVTHTYRRMAAMRKALLLRDAAAAGIYLADGEVPALGAILAQPALARTLELIAEGSYGATGLNNPAIVAATAVDLAKSAIEGTLPADQPRLTYTEPAVITKENVAEHYKADSVF